MEANITLKKTLAKLLPEWKAELSALVKEHGKVKVDEVCIDQVMGGMRDIKALPCDTSYLDSMEGIRFRGFTIPELREKLPKPAADAIPSPLGIWHLLLTGKLPTAAEVNELEGELKKRAALPGYVLKAIDALPKDMHPMTQFSIGVLAMQKESVFAHNYSKGMKKDQHWDAMFEDSLTLLARLPVIAAYIYRRTYKDGKAIPADPKLDWGANFAHMMGVDNKDYQNLARLYLLLHSDHESGNVSAHTGLLVGSALSDIYYSVSAALNGLAGPLHGLATQECLNWIQGLMKAHGGKTPTKAEVEKYAWDTLNAGRVIPGYGHAVLRNTDPRYVAQSDFGAKYLPNDPVYKTVTTMLEAIPPILRQLGKVKNPWPNVDAMTGCLQQHYGVTETDFYTVIFGVSRALGITAQAVWARGVFFPIERPKSVTTQMLKDAASKAKAGAAA
ncbi:MAG: citrate (Si)-synthase [Elusimicrobia bacterium]|nr:citrate (Si)-synthase [Elusimicrobiota bacterium]